MDYNTQVLNAIDICKNAIDLVHKILLSIDGNDATVKETNETFKRHDFTNAYNPKKQAIGRMSGLYTTGIPKAKSSKRTYRSVNVKNMNIHQKREYWRWTSFNKKMRKLGKPTISFDEYHKIYENDKTGNH